MIVPFYQGMQISFHNIKNYTGISKVSFGNTITPKSAQLDSNDNFVSRNFFHYLKKNLHSAKEIEKFLDNLSEEEKYVGSLPESWRKKFKPEELKEKTLETQKLFSDFASKSHTPKNTDLEELEPQRKELEEKLSKILNEECKISPIGKGQCGKVFRVQTKDEDLALKIYHTEIPKHQIRAHGQTKELANAIYLSDTMKPDQCTKFYFGKVTKYGEKDGFMVTKFIEGDDKKETPKKKYDEWEYKRFYLGDGKKSDNIINGVIVDFGAINKNFSNITMQNFAKKLFPMMKSGDVKGISEMREQHDNNPDFEEIKENETEFLQDLVDGVYGFLGRLADGYYTREEINAYRALGVDFSAIENADRSEMPAHILDAIDKYGFNTESKNE